MGIIEWVVLAVAFLIAWVFWDKHRLEKRLGKKITWDDYSELSKQSKAQSKLSENRVEKEVAAIRRMGPNVRNKGNAQRDIEICRKLTDYALSETQAHPRIISSLHFHLPLAREAYDEGNYEKARFYYTKIGYANYANDYSELRYAVLEEQTAFAKQDPLYHSIVSQVKQLLSAKGEIKQTTLYKQLSENQEDIRYAMYFADQTRELVRKKAGRTYLISRW